MSPPPRPVAANVPAPEESSAGLIKRFGSWKAFLVVAGTLVSGLIGAGAAAARYDSEVAKKPDVSSLSNRVGEVERHVDRLELGERWRDAALKGIAEKLGVFVPEPPPPLP